MIDHSFSLEEISEAHALFVEHEPRCTIYRDARRAIRKAVKEQDWDVEALTDAVWPFLRAWNKTHYRFNPQNIETHPSALHNLILFYRRDLRRYHGMTIEQLPKAEKPAVVEMFREWEQDLGGPVGGAKALHVLIPWVFPLWDFEIARGYKVRFAKAGHNGEKYWEFLRNTRRQCLRFRKLGYEKRNLVKRIDEWNYVTFTLGMPTGRAAESGYERADSKPLLRRA